MNMKNGKGKKSRAVVREAKREQRIAASAVAVNVTFRHVEPTDALRQYAERKLGHVGRVLKRPSEAHLILSVDKYRQCGEVIFKSGHLTATATEENTDLYAVIDLLADKVGRQLKRHVGKVKSKQMRTLSAPEVLAVAEQF
ncbi:MAG TPA: ribosome-associated translation inhibitor RaiA [Candidatus Binataceae bacterium]|nr:ribosome-associated translation inhibitor RaiA [Candidatus Binataceae bacterium]